MRTLFSLIGCPYCEIASLAVLKMNMSLPFDRRIRIVSMMPVILGRRYLGDASTRFLAAKFDHPNPMGWNTPVLVVDNPVITREHGVLRKKMGDRVLVHGAYTRSSYYTFLKHFLT